MTHLDHRVCLNIETGLVHRRSLFNELFRAVEQQQCLNVNRFKKSGSSESTFSCHELDSERKDETSLLPFSPLAYGGTILLIEALGSDINSSERLGFNANYFCLIVSLDVSVSSCSSQTKLPDAY